MKTFKRGNFSRGSALTGTFTHGYLKRWSTINNSRRTHSQNQTFSKKRTYSSSNSPPKKQVSQFRTQVPCEQSSTEIEVCNTSKMGPKSLLFLSIGSPFFYSTPIVSNPPPSNAFKFSYFSTEKEDKEVTSFILESAAAVIPHPQKAYKGGEDAHFISSRAVGVADGVGGWADVGVDPALYANKLMEGAKTFAEQNQDNSDPLKVLQEAYIFAKDIVGSSTACIVTIEDENIRAANLGDSGFMIVRDDKVIFRTKEQQHSFNFPFQLGTQSTSLPEHADIFELPVMDGDLIILGSDGLFDNVYDEEIVDICKDDTSEDPQQIADSIAQLASKFANHRTRLSPFAKAAQQQGHLFFIGGKLDDITVLVSRVRKTTKDSSPSTPDQFSMSDSEEGQKS